jgi:hypothetical protein
MGVAVSSRDGFLHCPQPDPTGVLDGSNDLKRTNVYFHADMGLKERALARTIPAKAHPGRYHPTDKLLAFLQGL